jgi:hypothetical protein
MGICRLHQIYSKCHVLLRPAYNLAVPIKAAGPAGGPAGSPDWLEEA